MKIRICPHCDALMEQAELDANSSCCVYCDKPIDKLTIGVETAKANISSNHYEDPIIFDIVIDRVLESLKDNKVQED